MVQSREHLHAFLTNQCTPFRWSQASHLELAAIRKPTQKAALYLVWVVNVGQKEARKVQEHQEVHDVAQGRKWFSSSNTESRNHILHDIEWHQEGEEEGCLMLHAVCLSNDY